MISTADVAQAIRARLAASAAVVNLVAGDIREENWMGDDYTYPSVRFYVQRLTPLGAASNCEDQAVDFSVTYRAATPSSKPAADGLKVTLGALVDQYLTGSGFNGRSRIKIVDVPGPVPEAENAWMARAQLTCRIHLL